jgi:hypothetical protein
MSAGAAVSPINKSWKELYRAAVFETDKNQVSVRIAHAEWALAVRARELIHADSEHLQERQAVDTAIYALHILRSTGTYLDKRKGRDETAA